MSTYINELNRAGFTIERIEEPEPSSLFDEELAEPSTNIILYIKLEWCRLLLLLRRESKVFIKEPIISNK